jgi:hypothetical protein
MIDLFISDLHQSLFYDWKQSKTFVWLYFVEEEKPGDIIKIERELSPNR